MKAPERSPERSDAESSAAELSKRPGDRRPRPASPPDARPQAAALRGLQEQADASGRIRRIAALQRMGAGRPAPTMQREVDTSPSPFLPAYGEDEQPGWQDEGGVPDWAKQEYRAEAPTTLIASVADGKIGSVYFDGGRIRTTHSHGPEEGDHSGQVTLQFNVDFDQAEPAFEAAFPGVWDTLGKQVRDKNGEGMDPKAFRRAVARLYQRRFSEWMSLTLRDTPTDHLPAWAVRVDGPDTAFDPSGGAPPEGVQLFEVFTSINGHLEGWHPSRGIAAKFETDKQAISVLRAAIRHLETEGITEPDARNRAFYDFVAKRLPLFIGNIRHPDEV